MVWDRVNNAVWMKTSAGTNLNALAVAIGSDGEDLAKGGRGGERDGDGKKKKKKTVTGEKAFVRPLDRNSRTVTDRWSTPELEAALRGYRAATVALDDEVKHQLRELSRLLLPYLRELSGCASMALVLGSLDHHAREVIRRSWTVPNLIDNPSSSPADHPHPPPHSDFRVQGMWPYWLDRNQAIGNDLDLEAIVLLTGPNMAGKSTLLRSVCAVALLASAGLAVPCAAAEVPFIDAMVLRSASRDSPVEGKSAFAVEMREMKTLTSLVSPASLVLVDELCRGTEADAGAAIAAAFLSKLDATRCYGIFSTHHHKILDMIDRKSLCLESTVEMRMGVERSLGPDGEQLTHTWQLVPGRSKESLAFQVARMEGVDEGILSLAERLSADIDQMGFDAARGTEVVAAATPPNPTLPGREDEPDYDGVSEEFERVERVSETFSNEIAGEFERDGLEGAIATRRQRLGASSGTNRKNGANGAPAAVVAERLRGVHPQVRRARTFKIAMDELRSSVEGEGTCEFKREEIGVVTPGQMPPPGAEGLSVVYICCTGNSRLYVGQTDRIGQRIVQHRRTFGADLILCYAFVGSGGASMARTVEGKLVRAFRRQNFALLNSDLDSGARMQQRS